MAQGNHFLLPPAGASSLLTLGLSATTQLTARWQIGTFAFLSGDVVRAFRGTGPGYREIAVVISVAQWAGSQQCVDDDVNFDEVTQEDESTCDSVDGSPMDGDVGKAFWFSKSSSEFVTSSYYCKRYDSYVRVVFAGGKIKGRRIYRRIEAVEVAPTIAAVSGVKPPSGSRTGPMLEVMEVRGTGRLQRAMEAAEAEIRQLHSTCYQETERIGK